MPPGFMIEWWKYVWYDQISFQYHILVKSWDVDGWGRFWALRYPPLSQARESNCIPHYSLGCNYLSPFEMLLVPKSSYNYTRRWHDNILHQQSRIAYVALGCWVIQEFNIDCVTNSFFLFYEGKCQQYLTFRWWEITQNENTCLLKKDSAYIDKFVMGVWVVSLCTPWSWAIMPMVSNLTTNALFRFVFYLRNWYTYLTIYMKTVYIYGHYTTSICLISIPICLYDLKRSFGYYK